jgi:hypothetical protein
VSIPFKNEETESTHAERCAWIALIFQPISSVQSVNNVTTDQETTGLFFGDTAYAFFNVVMVFPQSYTDVH